MEEEFKVFKQAANNVQIELQFVEPTYESNTIYLLPKLEAEMSDKEPGFKHLILGFCTGFLRRLASHLTRLSYKRTLFDGI